jgi:hypothetical protein
MAGSGFRLKECRPSIIQLERFSARRHDKVARLSGTSTNRFDDRSSDWSVFANGARLAVEIFVSALSARLRCLKNRHLVEGNHASGSRFKGLPRGVVERTLELELPEERRILGVLLLPYACAEPCRELDGLEGDVLLWRRPPVLRLGLAACFPAAVRDMGGDSDRAS